MTMRKHQLDQLVELKEHRQRCDCGWLRPQFVDIHDAEDKPLELGHEFHLLFDCPQCGARWDARYGAME